MVAQAGHFSTWDFTPHLHSTFETSSGYIKFCLQTKTTKPTNQNISPKQAKEEKKHKAMAVKAGKVIEKFGVL